MHLINQAASIAFALNLVANLPLGPVRSAPQNPSPPRDVVITVSGDIMDGIAGLEQSGVMFLTSARQPLRSLADLAGRGYTGKRRASDAAASGAAGGHAGRFA
jgi:hypothetical protein